MSIELQSGESGGFSWPRKVAREFSERFFEILGRQHDQNRLDLAVAGLDPNLVDPLGGIDVSTKDGIRAATAIYRARFRRNAEALGEDPDVSEARAHAWLVNYNYPNISVDEATSLLTDHFKGIRPLTQELCEQINRERGRS